MGATQEKPADLERELAAFHAALPELLSEEGKFALVIGDDVVSTFESYADAIQAGYAKAGLTPFLVKKITRIEEVASFSRPLALCLA